MTTADQIEQLHAAYNHAMDMTLPMTMCFSRWWYEAIQLGLTVEHVEICVASRLKFNREHPGHKKGLELKSLIRSDEDVAVVLNEVAVVLSQRRIKVVDPAKASVLRQTHRPTDLPQKDAEQAREALKRGMDDLRKAIEL